MTQPPNQTIQLKNGHFSTEDIQAAKSLMERCSATLIIRHMQTKTTKSSHLPPVRMAATETSMDSRSWVGRMREKEPSCTAGASAATVESSVEFPQEIKNKAAYDPKIHFWVYIQTPETTI